LTETPGWLSASALCTAAAGPPLLAFPLARADDLPPYAGSRHLAAKCPGPGFAPPMFANMPTRPRHRPRRIPARLSTRPARSPADSDAPTSLPALEASAAEQ